MSITSLSELTIQLATPGQRMAVRNGVSIDFAQFQKDVGVAAYKLKGKQAGALICHDSYHFSVGFFALLQSNARVLLPPQNNISSLKTLKEACDVTIDDTFIENLEGPLQELVLLDPHAPLIEVFTSGSTGLPQKIIKNLAFLEAEIDVLESMWGSQIGNGLVYATVPHQHIYGLTFKILWPLARGSAFTTYHYTLWEDVIEALTPDGVLISSPAHLSRLDGLSALPPNKRLKAIFTAGAPLSSEAAQKTEILLGCSPREIFGSTETGAIATRHPTRQDSWTLLPGIEMKIDAEQKLHIRSPFMDRKWFETKDIVEPTVDGFRFKGRADTIVKIEGKRVSLAAVEKRLEELIEIESAAAVMLPCSPSSLAVAIVLSDNGKAMLEKLGPFRMNRHLRQQLLITEEAASIPRHWQFVEALPVQSMGKRRAKDIIALFSEAT